MATDSVTSVRQIQWGEAAEQLASGLLQQPPNIQSIVYNCLSTEDYDNVIRTCRMMRNFSALQTPDKPLLPKQQIHNAYLDFRAIFAQTKVYRLIKNTAAVGQPRVPDLTVIPPKKSSLHLINKDIVAIFIEHLTHNELLFVDALTHKRIDVQCPLLSALRVNTDLIGGLNDDSPYLVLGPKNFFETKKGQSNPYKFVRFINKSLIRREPSEQPSKEQFLHEIDASMLEGEPLCFPSYFDNPVSSVFGPPDDFRIVMRDGFVHHFVKGKLIASEPMYQLDSTSEIVKKFNALNPATHNTPFLPKTAKAIQHENSLVCMIRNGGNTCIIQYDLTTKQTQILSEPYVGPHDCFSDSTGLYMINNKEIVCIKNGNRKSKSFSEYENFSYVKIGKTNFGIAIHFRFENLFNHEGFIVWNSITDDIITETQLNRFRKIQFYPDFVVSAHPHSFQIFHLPTKQWMTHSGPVPLWGINNIDDFEFISGKSYAQMLAIQEAEKKANADQDDEGSKIGHYLGHQFIIKADMGDTGFKFWTVPSIGHLPALRASATIPPPPAPVPIFNVTPVPAPQPVQPVQPPLVATVTNQIATPILQNQVRLSQTRRSLRGRIKLFLSKLCLRIGQAFRIAISKLKCC